ncbi:hypothetical protein GS444_10010 [Rhodococcus hoagii]|nr:hypothetical protein [Prescottella equi]
MYPNISPNIQPSRFNYLVTASCARSTPLMTTMHYSGSLGKRHLLGQGPDDHGVEGHHHYDLGRRCRHRY